MRIIRLQSKAITCSSHAEAFLNGLVSNSLDKPDQAFLNMHGRIIATAQMAKISEDEFLLVVASAAVDALLAHLERYARLNKTTLQVTDLRVYVDLDKDIVPEGTDIGIDLDYGRMLVSTRDLPDTISMEEFTRFRLDHHWPLHTVDFHSGEMVLNVDENRYVSFTKGCFLGQEPVAKVHHRSKPSWRLVVKNMDACSGEEQEKMTSVMVDAKTGQQRGFVMVRYGA